MIKILLAFDEKDADIGFFIQGCLEDYQSYFISNTTDEIDYVNSISLNSLNLKLKTEKLKKFIFAAYSHGTSSKLVSGSGDYISEEINFEQFSDSFFYTVSCNAGDSLGTKLISNGCLSFFGYKNKFYCWAGYKHFSYCANFGFFKFLDGQSSKDVFEDMKAEYDNQIDILYKENPLVASYLRSNRDSLVWLGQNITVEDLTE